MTEPEVREEARRVADAYTGSPGQLVSFLSSQLAVVKGQAHMLVELCGLTITVTGFSGAHMIRAGSFSAYAMVTGILFILMAAVQCLRILTQIRWVSQDLRDDPVETAYAVIARRNLHQKRVAFAGSLVTVGLAAYLLAVAAAALFGSNPQ